MHIFIWNARFSSVLDSTLRKVYRCFLNLHATAFVELILSSNPYDPEYKLIHCYRLQEYFIIMQLNTFLQFKLWNKRLAESSYKGFSTKK